MKVVVGGVSQLYQGDLDLGRRIAARLEETEKRPWVEVEDFHYGAVAVAQRLQDVAPEGLILAGAEPMGKAPGTITRRRIDAPRAGAEAAGAVGDAVTGFVSIDLLIEVCSALEALPPRVVAFVVEPEGVAPATELSDTAQAALEEVLEAITREIGLTPLYGLARQLGSQIEDGRRLEPSPALEAARRLVAALARCDRSGELGSTLALREELRVRIAAGETGQGMDHLDWVLWWALIEGLDEVQRATAGDSR